MVRHCPRCELRFASEPELAEHLSVDHEADIAVFERFRYPSSREAKPLYADLIEPGSGRRRFLVVANQTLRSPALTAEVLRRMEQGPVEIVVLVPATHTADYPRRDSDAPPTVRPMPDEPGMAQARWRLRRTVEELRAAGAKVYGQLGPADPYEAAGSLLESQQFDEVIMATLPPASSRWLAMDVPTRIRRLYGIPVTVVSEHTAELSAVDAPQTKVTTAP